MIEHIHMNLNCNAAENLAKNLAFFGSIFKIQNYIFFTNPYVSTIMILKQCCTEMAKHRHAER